MSTKYFKSVIGAFFSAIVLALASTSANSAMILVELCGDSGNNCAVHDPITLSGLTPADKVDWDKTLPSPQDGDINGLLSVTIDDPDGDGEGSTGTWSYSDGTDPLQFLSIKFGNYVAVFDTNGETSGIFDTNLTAGVGVWFTTDLDITGCCLNNAGQPIDMSNVGVYVPVPAAVWLFGTGLLGLVGVARRKRA